MTEQRPCPKHGPRNADGTCTECGNRKRRSVASVVPAPAPETSPDEADEAAAPAPPVEHPPCRKHGPRNADGSCDRCNLRQQLRLVAQEEGEELFPPPVAPMAVARRLLDGQKIDGQLTQRYWRGGWMRWDRTCWTEIEQDAVKSFAYATLEHVKYEDDSGRQGPEIKPWNPNRRRVSDVLDALSGITHMSETVDPPAWLDSYRPYPAGEFVACTNGLLHVGTRKLIDLTPRYFNRVAVPFAYDPLAPPPARWLDFLAQLWPDDEPAIDALQEFFGYVLSGRTDLHKILLVIGPPRSGKGTIARILAALIGKGNAAGPTLASLGTNFGLSPLLGKPLAIVSDARLGGQNANQVVERLLSISGEDMLTVDRKFREPWTGKLPSRFVILSNELPRFGDASGAIANRFIVLTMANSWLGKEDSKLTPKLFAELTGILSWALDGLDRLTTQQVFTEPPSSIDAIRLLQDIVSPVSAFVRDWCLLGPEYAVRVETLYAAWRDWCEENGREKPGTVQSLGRDLRAVSPGIRVSQPRDGITGKQVRFYNGITLNEDHNGAPRVSARVSPQPDPAPTRTDTHTNPLWLSSCAICGEPIDPAAGTIHPACDGQEGEPVAAPGQCMYCQQRTTVRVTPAGSPLCRLCDEALNHARPDNRAWPEETAQ